MIGHSSRKYYESSYLLSLTIFNYITPPFTFIISSEEEQNKRSMVPSP